MDRPSEKVELFEAFAVEQIVEQVRGGFSYGEYCFWCFTKI